MANTVDSTSNYSMERQYKTSGRLINLISIVEELRSTSEAFLNHCLELGGLFNFLSLPKSPIHSPFLLELMSYYNPSSNTFNIRGQYVLGITLEDVLFLARIRIDGTAVLVKDYSNKHCFDIFGEEIDDFEKLYDIIYDNSLDWKKRKAALLMVIVQCIIMPTSDGKKYYAALFECLRDPDEISGKYAWGAGMLAFLQYHMEKLYNNPRTLLPCTTWFYNNPNS